MNPESFWSRVDIRSSEECWEYQSTRTKQGYGRFTNCSAGPDWPKGITAHRYAYFLHSGVNPGEWYVLHSCDNPPCCNPHHLRLGTFKDNVADRVARHRDAPIHGSKNPFAKLTEEQVVEMRRRFKPGKRGDCIAAGKAFGVSKHTASQILRRVRWDHLPANVERTWECWM